MRLKIILIALLLGIIFPMHWIGRLSSAYERVFDAVFSPEWMHIVAHAVLFASLGAVLVVVTGRRFRWIDLIAFCAVTLAVGTLQELFQWLTQDKITSLATALRAGVFDLGVDLLGSIIGIASLFWISKKSIENQPLSALGRSIWKNR